MENRIKNLLVCLQFWFKWRMTFVGKTLFTITNGWLFMWFADPFSFTFEFFLCFLHFRFYFLSDCAFLPFQFLLGCLRNDNNMCECAQSLDRVRMFEVTAAASSAHIQFIHADAAHTAILMYFYRAKTKLHFPFWFFFSSVFGFPPAVVGVVITNAAKRPISNWMTHRQTVGLDKRHDMKK